MLCLQAEREVQVVYWSNTNVPRKGPTPRRGHGHDKEDMVAWALVHVRDTQLQRATHVG